MLECFPQASFLLESIFALSKVGVVRYRLRVGSGVPHIWVILTFKAPRSSELPTTDCIMIPQAQSCHSSQPCFKLFFRGYYSGIIATSYDSALSAKSMTSGRFQSIMTFGDIKSTCLPFGSITLSRVFSFNKGVIKTSISDKETRVLNPRTCVIEVAACRRCLDDASTMVCSQTQITSSFASSFYVLFPQCAIWDCVLVVLYGVVPALPHRIYNISSIEPILDVQVTNLYI